MKLTPIDIANPKRASGYDHVGRNRNAFRAQVYGAPKGTTKHANGFAWWGPNRKAPDAAAQDYCDYVNGNPTALAAALKKVKRDHSAARDPMNDDEVKAALGVLRDARAQRRGREGFVYLIGEVGCWEAVKVGYSVKPAARVGELQTGNSRPLHLLAAFQGTVADERALHMKYVDDNLLLEWFKPTSALLAEFGLEIPSET